MSEYEDPVFEREAFEFREDVALRIEQQAKRALSGCQIADVTWWSMHSGAACVVRAGERKYGAEAGVNEDSGGCREFLLGSRAAELRWQYDAKERREFGARSTMDLAIDSFRRVP